LEKCSCVNYAGVISPVFLLAKDFTLDMLYLKLNDKGNVHWQNGKKKNSLIVVEIYWFL